MTTHLPILLQVVGLVGLAVGVLILFGVGAAVLAGSVCVIVAGTVLERERR